MEYLHLSITELHNLLISGKVTPKTLLDEALRKAKVDNNNAFEYIAEKEAYRALETLDKKDKHNLLWGIPYAAKDNFSTKDIPTTASSNILDGYTPIFDAEVIKKLNDCGAILIGKTTMDELAMGGNGTSGRKGTTYNPWDPKHEHLIGGSSCGSASVVASGIVPFALGSDTGDSVRKPASHGGLVGLKPSWGRISRYGLFPFAQSMDHVAFFTRNVFDASIILNSLAGYDQKDMTSLEEPFNADLTKNIKNMRIAVIKNIVDSISNKTILNAFNKSVENLIKRGFIVDYVEMNEELLKAIYPTYIIISCAEATSNNANLDGIKFGIRKEGQTFEDIVLNTRTEGFGEMIKRRFVIGGYSLLKENQEELFFNAQRCRRVIVDEINNILNKYDAIYCPAVPSPAPLEKNSSSDKLSNEYLIADNWMAIGNFGGFPSITVPIGFDNDLPFGANINCKAKEDEKVLLLASIIEKDTGLANLSVLNKKGNK